jgi:hypothetical protein
MLVGSAIARTASLGCSLAVLLSLGGFAFGQVVIDLTSEAAKKANDKRTLDDAAANSTALIDASFCVRDKDNSLFIPGWTELLDLTDSKTASGVILRVQVLSG